MRDVLDWGIWAEIYNDIKYVEISLGNKISLGNQRYLNLDLLKSIGK